ncbi:hypothetical protein RB653_000603 [Dictyostelium firmibasis]|uniref:Uncharacterized protein n=1 Tax=Dictyostelium firmibasis TaxID=79012 RepID=A0AAN7U2Z1_9MYCE
MNPQLQQQMLMNPQIESQLNQMNQISVLNQLNNLSPINSLNNNISNYVPVIGRDLITPADIPRASLLTYSNQNSAMNFAKSLQIETPGDVFNITFSKYYLNNIVSLSNNNAFGAQAHYNSLVSLYNNVNNLSLLGLNNTVGYINIISKYTNFDTSKFDSITTSINNFKASINSILQSSIDLSNAMNSTKNSLSPNSPNTATAQIVRDNYDLAINSVLSIGTHLNNMKSPLDEMLNTVYSIKEEVNQYVDTLLTDQEYMDDMNTMMRSFLFSSTTFYSRSILFTRLKDFF